MPSSIRAISEDVYHIERLAGEFQYVDAVVVDTPILDQTDRTTIRDARKLEERLERAEVFASYLNRQWMPLEQFVTGFDWSEASKRLSENIAHIRTALEKY
jgi:hypothetical protein